MSSISVQVRRRRASAVWHRRARVALLSAALCLAFGLLTIPSANAATATFGFTGGEQIFEVPDGVTSLDVVAVGGRGGTGGAATGGIGVAGGFGATARCNLAVTPGQLLFINVGGNGGLVSGGFNGGGDGGDGSVHDGGGGGGATDIRTISRADGESLNSRLVIAGGGGGGGGNSADSAAGGGAGGAGGTPSGGGGGGGGSAGGSGGDGGDGAEQNGPGGNGSAGQGGGGVGSGPGGGGGGGGGGAFGGGGALNGTGGTAAGGGGGGGSTSFAATATRTSIQADSAAAPLVRLTYGAVNRRGLKFGKIKRNKKKGTALLPVAVPGTGELSLGGKGIVKKRPPSHGFGWGFEGASLPLAKEVKAAGTVNLRIKARGNKKEKLLDTGNVRVKAVITFKPTSGDPVSDSKRVRLKKN